MKQHKLNKALLNVARLNVVNLNYVGERSKGGSPVVDDGYFHFADPEVERICIENWSSDGVGCTLEDIQAVTDIGTKFSKNSEITSFDELEKFTGVTSIAQNAFLGDTALTSCKLSSNTVTLSNNSFDGCTSLVSVNINHVTKIGLTAFYNCTSLGIELILPYLQSIGGRAFEGSAITAVKDLGSITELPDGNATYSRGVFAKCTSLESLVLPSSLTKIGSCAFRYCSLLSEINIPSSVVSVGEASFQGNVLLRIEELNLTNLTTLGSAAFDKCDIRSIKSLGKITTIPNGSNYTGVFSNNVNLSSVVLPDTLISIGSYCFYGCTSLKTITIPKNVTKLNGADFMNTSLESVVIESPSIALSIRSFNGITTLVSIVGMESITAVADSCFSGCKNFAQTINMPKLESLTGNYVFGWIASERVENLGVITSYAQGFHQCPNLKFIRFPNTLETFGSNGLIGCTALETLIFEAVTPPTFSGSFSTTNESFLIYVPDASVTAYREASGWVNYADRIKPLSEYVE